MTTNNKPKIEVFAYDVVYTQTIDIKRLQYKYFILKENIYIIDCKYYYQDSSLGILCSLQTNRTNRII